MKEQQVNPSIIIKAQEHANERIEKEYRRLGITQPPWNETVKDPDMMHIYMLGLVEGAISEYNKQLLAALKEQNGILVEDFTQFP